MDLIINFYKELDTLNLIIFWGIIIVIILLLIFAVILINKNKKLKRIVEQNNKYEEELPIKKEEIDFGQNIEKVKEQESETLIPSSEEIKITHEVISKPIEVENNFVVEEHVLEYNKDIDDIKTKENKDEKNIHQINTKPTIEIPTKPYQRNVLREMSLSQTSPIGINRQVPKEDKKTAMIEDLEESLNNEEINDSQTNQMMQEIKPNNTNIIDNQTKKELTNIEDISYRKTEITQEIPTRVKEYNLNSENQKMTKSQIDEELLETPARELLNNQQIINNNRNEQNASEKYLEEVSRKLAEAEIPDEIERTNYELKQEEDAIISYKELMEKKDTIQTIDEEEAVISIEELMNRTNNKPEEPEESKLYNLSEEEANDNFIKELKQFRNYL